MPPLYGQSSPEPNPGRATVRYLNGSARALGRPAEARRNATQVRLFFPKPGANFGVQRGETLRRSNITPLATVQLPTE
jgi:hypothetical protein